MALLKCEECKGKVSSDADACPHCGKKVTATTKPVTPAVNASPWRVLVFLVIIGAFLALFAEFGEAPATASRSTTSSERSVKSQFSAWDGSHRGLVREVKSRLNDPGSFEHIETRYHTVRGTISLYMKFRARNAFGGMVVNEVLAETPERGGPIKIISGI